MRRRATPRHGQGRTGNASHPKITSLAVLPLKNLSGDPAEEYLADGMTEALIGRLAGIHDLRVISRTSVMRFKDTQLAVPEIARTLNVDAILEGSVIRQGSRLRVRAQLIRAATDEHFWSETYDRGLPDLLALQSDVGRLDLVFDVQLREGLASGARAQQRGELARVSATSRSAHCAPS